VWADWTPGVGVFERNRGGRLHLRARLQPRPRSSARPLPSARHPHTGEQQARKVGVHLVDAVGDSSGRLLGEAWAAPERTASLRRCWTAWHGTTAARPGWVEVTGGWPRHRWVPRPRHAHQLIRELIGELAVADAKIRTADKQLGDIDRFPTAAHFASCNGTASIEASSGDQRRHRLSRAGNRRINGGPHIKAVVQLRHDMPRPGLLSTPSRRGQEHYGGPARPQATPFRRGLQAAGPRRQSSPNQWNGSGRTTGSDSAILNHAGSGGALHRTRRGSPDQVVAALQRYTGRRDVLPDIIRALTGPGWVTTAQTPTTIAVQAVSGRGSVRSSRMRPAVRPDPRSRVGRRR
jgi:hypothetical protein